MSPRLRAVEPILVAVANTWMVSVNDLRGKGRHKTTAEARNAAYWLARKTTRLSYPEIGRAIGNRDHTTVMSGAKRIEHQKLSDKWLSTTLENILAAMQAGAEDHELA